MLIFTLWRGEVKWKKGLVVEVLLNKTIYTFSFSKKIIKMMIIDSNVFSESLTFFATIGTFILGGVALKTWKDEYIGKKKIELASDIVENACNVQDLMLYIRSGSTFGYESDKIKKDLKEEIGDFKLKENKVHYLVPHYRIAENHEKIMRFMQLKNKAQIYWEEDVVQLFGKMNQIINRIDLSSKHLYQFDLDKDQRQKNENDIWNMGEEDKISLEVSAIVEELKFNLEPLYKDKKIKWKKIN
ncbi:MAG: hypothetical protein ISQ34_02185 [Rickettsiales bacterium]|nr:hypothetical protein [Rickettsiales bacterium]